MHTHLGFPNTDSNLVIVGNNPQSMNNFLPSNTNSNTNSNIPKKFKYKKQYRELKQQFEELECEYYDNQVLYDEANNRIVELQEHNNLVEEQYNQIAEQYKQITEEYNEFKNNFEYHMMENGHAPYFLNDINHMEETIESLTNQVNYIGQDYDIVIEEMKVQEEEVFRLREVNVFIENELHLEKNESQKLRQQNHNIITERNKYQSQVAELTEEMNDNIELQRKITKLESANTVLENTKCILEEQNELLVNQIKELKNMVKQSGDNIMVYITKSRNTDRLIKQLRDEKESLIKKNTLLQNNLEETNNCIIGYQVIVEDLNQRLLEYKIIEEERKKNQREFSNQVSDENIEAEYDNELETWDICEIE